ncbi:MAG: isochorismatase family protein [Acidobacteriota bacterium]
MSGLLMPTRKDSLLLLLDVQEKLVARMPDPLAIVRSVLRLTRGAKILGVPVVVSALDVDHEGPVVEDLLQLVRGMPQFRRGAFSAMSHEGLSAELGSSGRNTLILAGLETHVAVQQTALSAMMLGYRVHVAAGAVACRGEEEGRLALRRMDRAGAQVESVEAILMQLVERADTDEARAIAAILTS